MNAASDFDEAAHLEGGGRWDDPIATAAHEAAHTVVAVILGRHVERVSAVASNGTLGVADVVQDEPVTQEEVDAAIRISLAGPLGERRHAGLWGYSWWAPGSKADLQTAAERGRRFYPNRAKWRQARSRLQRETLELLACHWNAVELLASQLAQRGTLGASEIGQLLAPFGLKMEAHPADSAFAAVLTEAQGIESSLAASRSRFDVLAAECEALMTGLE